MLVFETKSFSSAMKFGIWLYRGKEIGGEKGKIEERKRNYVLSHKILHIQLSTSKIKKHWIFSDLARTADLQNLVHQKKYYVLLK